MTDSRIESSRKKVAVIGGGISGLSAAHRLIELSRERDSRIDITLFEASDRIGGVFGTTHIDEYLVETGADMFITNQPAALNLCERLGISDQLIPTVSRFRGSLVLRKGKPVRVPEGFMLLSPAKILPVLKSPIFSPLGKLRMGLEYLIPRRRHDVDETLAGFVRRRFGQEALERLIQPLVGGIYTADPEKLSLKATMPRFLDMERQHRSLIVASRKKAASGDTTDDKGSGARYGLFTAPRDGMSVLQEKLAEEVGKHAKLQTGERVETLSLADSGGGTVQLESGHSESFAAIIVALPAHHASDVLRTNPDTADDNRQADSINQLSDLLGEIEYSSAAVVVSGHQLKDIDHPLDAFGLVIPAIERRQIIAVSFTSRKFPGRAPDGRVLLRTFVGGAMQPELLTSSDEEILTIVSRELESILGVRGTPDFARVCRHNRSMPQYHIGHCDRVAQIRKLTESMPGLELAGNAYSGVGIPDCISSGESAAERVIHSLAD